MEREGKSKQKITGGSIIYRCIEFLATHFRFGMVFRRDLAQKLAHGSRRTVKRQEENRQHKTAKSQKEAGKEQYIKATCAERRDMTG